MALQQAPVTLFLAVHPSQNDTFGRAERLVAGETPNPFIDPQAWQALLARFLGP